MRILKQMSRNDLVKWGVVVLLSVFACFLFRQMFDHVLIMFADPREDMSHGYVIPLVSIFIIWKQRDKWATAKGDASWLGLVCAVFFLALAFLGYRGGQTRIALVAFIGLVWSVPFALWGLGAARCLLFPAAYLLFTVPVSSFIDFFTIHLRIFSSFIATGILNGIGIEVQQSGTALICTTAGSQFNVDVAEPCSGIRSLFALMALTAAWAYFFQRTFWKKWVLFLCSIPVAILGNMARIISICVVAVLCGEKTALGYYHNLAGYPIFLFGLLLIMLISDRLNKIGKAESPATVDGSDEKQDAAVPAISASDDHLTVRTICVTIVLTVLGGTACYLQQTLQEPVFNEATFIHTPLPNRVGEYVGTTPWFCHNETCLASFGENKLVSSGGAKLEDGSWKCPACGKKLYHISLGEKTELPDDTQLYKRNYLSPDGVSYNVNVVISGRSRGSIHRAEFCLPSQGYTMEQAGTIPLEFGGRTIHPRCIHAIKTGSVPFTLLYWFESENRTCSSHTRRILMDVWDRSVHNRINRWAMFAFTISPPVDTPESRKRLSEFLQEFYPEVVHKNKGSHVTPMVQQ